MKHNVNASVAANVHTPSVSHLVGMRDSMSILEMVQSPTVNLGGMELIWMGLVRETVSNCAIQAACLSLPKQ